MAEIAPTSVVKKLEAALEVPEPMCLALIQVEPISGWGDGGLEPGSLAPLVKERLHPQLRRYDQYLEIDETAAALLLRTLADVQVLSKRMHLFFEMASRPYEVGNVPYEVRVALGAAVRKPQDTATTLLARVDDALTAAGSDQSSGLTVV